MPAHYPDDPFSPWTVFQWGSRGLWQTTGYPGIYTMAFLPIPFGLRIVVRGHAVEGQLLIHTFHAKAPTATPSAADCAAVNAIVTAWISANYRQMWNTGVMCDDVTTTAINASPAPQAQAVSGILGNRVGLMNTSNITMSVKSQTGNSGRTNRGHQFAWPAVGLDLLTPGNNRFTNTYRVALVAVFNLLVASMNTGGYPLAVLSKTDQALKLITNYVAVDDYIDSQRRRLLGRGR